MKAAMTIFLSALLLYCFSCGEELPPLVFNEPTISVGLGVHGENPYVTYGKQESIFFEFSIANHGDEPLDGSFFFVGTMYIKAGDDTTTYEVDFQAVRDSYVAILPEVPYVFSLRWLQDLGGGRYLWEYADGPGDSVPVKAWARIQVLGRFDMFETNEIRFSVIYE